MLDLQRHLYCPIWDNAVKPTESSYDAALEWTGLRYACRKVLGTYCKVFDQQALFDLIVRYKIHKFCDKKKRKEKPVYSLHTPNFGCTEFTSKHCRSYQTRC